MRSRSDSVKVSGGDTASAPPSGRKSTPASRAAPKAVPTAPGFRSSTTANAARFSGRLAPGLQDQFLDLLALMMAKADPHTGESAVRTAHRQRAVLLVEKRFRDPEFTARDVAAEINLSERYLQKLFADDDQTVSGTIRGRRIAEARKLLDKRAVTGSSIASIAAASGFADAAYFSRVFRQETGVSPTAYVHRSAEDGNPSPADPDLS
ncbi:helix-turn-helix domain-containing protein [Gordonia desulfuricans]|uniref:Helix-turn-helix domain-containing protein n=1 Tax=Gordonia desulfuricans TaxID=89051 RepID=A0A7K3LSD5_9ACTN|nr:helix-turn-helix domain-containing protein [Gordonia desulfuricans]NDK90921.1 helix-turn-helix domain-containing protein [Gordonia desulfuricans]